MATENPRLVYWPGVASFVLGAVGLLLFFLPVLGMPLSITGLVVGLIALLAAFGGRSSLRLSVLGTALCIFALGINLAITLAPLDLLSQEAHPSHTWQPPPGPPYVAPPADPGMWLNDRDR